MAFVAVNEVTKVYRPDGAGSEVRVVSGVSLEISEGEFVCLMGPSGSGKSTLLTIVGAMNHPSDGTVLIDGIDVYGLPGERRADFRREYLGFVFQQHHLMPYLNTIENAMLPFAAAGGSAKQGRERAMTALESVGLADKASRLPNQLSGGEQGRLAIASGDREPGAADFSRRADGHARYANRQRDHGSVSASERSRPNDIHGHPQS